MATTEEIPQNLEEKLGGLNLDGSEAGAPVEEQKEAVLEELTQSPPELHHVGTVDTTEAPSSDDGVVKSEVPEAFAEELKSDHDIVSQAEEEKPTEQFETPAEQFETPTEQSETPAERFDTPTVQSETLAEQYESPTEKSETPAEEFKSPTEQTETRTEQFETPTEDSETVAPPAEEEKPTETVETVAKETGADNGETAAPARETPVEVTHEDADGEPKKQSKLSSIGHGITDKLHKFVDK